MRETNERMLRLTARILALERRRERRELAGLSALNGGLLIALLGVVSALSGGRHRLPTDQIAGSSLLADSAGGYVLVGVIAFAMGAAITLLCIKSRRRAAWERAGPGERRTAQIWSEPVPTDAKITDKTLKENVP